jgi:hypothetical protein
VDVINLGWDQQLAPLAATTHGNSRAAVDGFKLCLRIAHADRSRHCVRAEPRLLRLAKMPTWREIRGAYGRGRRALRQAMLEPLLVGWPVLRDVVMNALSARGHLVLCELGDVRFFVDPRDRVVGAWLMWHAGGIRCTSTTFNCNRAKRSQFFSIKPISYESPRVAEAKAEFEPSCEWPNRSAMSATSQ